MACEVCEHCREEAKGAPFVMKHGYSYHEHCLKCYVCSETNLQNAEIFKGVIFCSSCSQRIFQGCATARRAKTGRPRDRSRSQGRRDRSKRQGRRYDKPRLSREGGIIELARLAASADSSSSPRIKRSSFIHKSLDTSSELVPPAAAEKVKKDVNKNRNLKRKSVEMGVTTDFTQEILHQMKTLQDQQSPLSTNQRQRREDREDKSRHRHRRNKKICSDLRVAELGISTEIANMALRQLSEVPMVLEQTTSPRKMQDTESPSNLTDDTEQGVEEWCESPYSSQRSDSQKIRLTDRRITSILKIPFEFFKHNVLGRSSLVSVLMDSSGDIRPSLIGKVKSLFYEDPTEHRQRGLKQLYSTINRLGTPHRLGWLGLGAVTLEYSDEFTSPSSNSRSSESPVSPVSSNREESTSIEKHSSRKCRHFERSHSYRCMRAQVMKLAGPTKSELYILRDKLKRMILPSFLLNNNRDSAVMTSSHSSASDVQDDGFNRSLVINSV